MNKLALAIIGLLIATAAWGQIVGSGTNTGSYFDPRDTLGMGIINNFTTSGGGTGNDLLAQTGQPIYSTGTTPILVQ